MRGHDTRVARETVEDGPSRAVDTDRAAADGVHAGTPLPPAVVVGRPRVMRALARGDARLVSVVAPGGYGKTTALAQWARSDGRAVAWVTVTDRHDDPVVLGAAVGEALAGGGLPAPHRPVTRSASPWPAHVAEIAALPGEVGAPLILVLDDVHRLASDEALGVVGALAQGVPRGSCLVLSGRSEVASLVPAARVSGRLAELGPRELVLTDGETAELLDALGVPASPEAAAALTRHTEGWPAGVYLTALARGGADGIGPLDRDVDRFVADYLWSEHLAGLPEDELAFLMGSAVLDRFSAAMCDAVLGRDDSARMIERAEGSSLFVMPLDRVRRWYRYHELFRGALRRELDGRDPAAAHTVLLRASDWCAANDLGEEAMAYATEAGDEPRMARLFAALALPLYRVGRIATLERWLAEMDRRGMIDRHPEVAVLGAVLHVFRGRAILAERWRDAAERATAARGPREEQDPVLVGWLDVCAIFMCRGGLAGVREAAARVLAPGRPAVLAPPAMWMAANAAALLGDDREFDAVLEEAARVAESTGGVMAAVAARGQLAARALGRGDRERARQEISSARTLVAHAPFDGYVEMTILLAAEAHLLAAEGDVTSATAVLAAAERLRPSLSRAFPVFSVEALLEMARAHLALGDPRAARDCITQAERIASQSGPLGTLGEHCAVVRALADAAPAGDRASAGLTGAEVRLLPLLATHLTLEEIGEHLFVSRNTVKKHAASIYRKLGASSRHEAVVRATAAGLLDAPSAALGRAARR